MGLRFSYGTTRLRDLGIRSSRSDITGKNIVTGVEVNGEEAHPTTRFWESLSRRFGLTANVFRYFDHDEVFSRVSKRASSDRIQYCVERDENGNRWLLGLGNPSRTPFTHDDTTALLARHGAGDVYYNDGVVTSTHTPHSGQSEFCLHGDAFKNRFVMETPIDGYGNPRVYLSLLRLLCVNGAIAYSPAFRREINLGDDPRHGLKRAFESYDNGQGFAALRQRFSSAQNSWLSLHEYNRLYKTLVRLHNTNQFTRSSVLSDFHRMTGKVNELYGLANLDGISAKRLRVLPAKCRVYDALNFVSEVATHHALPESRRALQAQIGTLVADEYDLEGTGKKLDDFQDFFVGTGKCRASVN